MLGKHRCLFFKPKKIFFFEIFFEIFFERYFVCIFFIFCFMPGFSYALKLKKSSFDDLPGFDINYKGKNNDLPQVLSALKLSCSDLLKRSRYHSYNSDIRYQKKYLQSCRKLVSLPSNYSNNKIKSFIEINFKPYLVLDENSNATGVFTGYYQPSILGDLKRTAKFDVPIYGRPYDFDKNKMADKMPDRAAISKGPVLKNAPILAWVESKVERFFLQVQGSGTIILPNHKKLLLGYDSQNGHPYYPIGRYLVENNYIAKSKISMQSIVSWLKYNPSKSQKVMNLNPSFVYFKILHQNSPNGAQGLPLTPRISMAVDREYIPLGSLLYLSTYTPKLDKLDKGKIIRGKSLNKFMVAQDTGGAIKGSVRGDVFWGVGNAAKFLAGHMNSKGRYWLLIPKGVKL